MSKSQIAQEIRDLLKQHNGVLLAHNYMRDEVQEIADITGDSLGLSIEASKTDAELIVFCGVHFMAESAAILSPNKKVILPRPDAGCPMADMVTVEELEELKAKNRGVPVVTYVNSSAEIKAHSDICCTSANALTVVRSLKEKKLIFVPDRNLGRWIAKFVPEKEFIFWEGFCPTHERMTVEAVLQKKKEHPEALFICHPESAPQISEMADHVCSTSGMYEYCKNSPSKSFIVGTEAGILYKLQLENRDKEFFIASPALICPNMKLTSLEDVLLSLKTLSPIVTVPEEIRTKAKSALDRMLAIPRD